MLSYLNVFHFFSDLKLQEFFSYDPRVCKSISVFSQYLSLLFQTNATVYNKHSKRTIIYLGLCLC